MFKPLNGFTKAKIIETIQTRMLDHPSRSGTDGTYGACSYKAADGNRCAVGVFIPNGHEAETYVGYADDLLQQFPELNQKMPLELDALAAMQEIHDNRLKMDTDRRPDLIAWVNANVE